jgi:protein SCO1/2
MSDAIKPRYLVRAAILLALAGSLLGSLPLIQKWVNEGGYYGHYNRVSFPQIPGAPVPEGGLNVVFYGFGGCSEACPAQLTNLLQLQPRVDPQKVRFIYVALDADVQDRAHLESVFEAWGPSFQAVVPGSVSTAQELALSYGGFASDQGLTADGAQRFNHDGRLHVISDQNIKVLTYLTAALDISLVADDLNRLSTELYRSPGMN